MAVQVRLSRAFRTGFKIQPFRIPARNGRLTYDELHGIRVELPDGKVKNIAFSYPDSDKVLSLQSAVQIRFPKSSTGRHVNYG